MQQFGNYLEMILLIQEKLEQEKLPQSDTELRTWGELVSSVPVNDQRDHNQIDSPQTGGATFLLRIQFRQNASWQGQLQWLEKKSSVPFRSLLEMTLLMVEALAGKVSGEGKIFPWEDKEEVS